MARKKLIADANEAILSLDSTGIISGILSDDLNKRYGKIAYSLGEEATQTDINEFVSTGCTVLDSIISNDLSLKLGLNNGGLAVCRLAVLLGENQTGKSLIANHILINTQKIGGVPILIDEENSTSIEFLQRMGMKFGQAARDAKLNPLIYQQVGSVEGVFDVIETIINKIRDLNSNKLITIVWDSVAATPTKEEIEKGYDESTMAVKARMLSLGLRKLMPLIGKQRVLLVFTNQVRTKMGVSFGDPTTAPGGYAIPHHASVIVKLYKSGVIKDKQGEPIGTGVRAKVQKNRISSPGRECHFSIYFANGVDDLESTFNKLVDLGIIRKPTNQSYELDYNGQTYKFKSTQWRENVESIDGLAEHLRITIMEKNIIKFDSAAADTDEETGNVKLVADDEIE
jgi:recombination protein RecA